MKDICIAAIISYNPDIKRLLENVTAICNQVSHVIIVDNGSDNYDAISTKLSTFDNVSIHASAENKGIAWALNQCFTLANDYQVSWVLTLDQDSVCPPDMITKYAAYLNRINDKATSFASNNTNIGNFVLDKLSRIGILCPTIVDRNVGTIEGDSTCSAVISKCITSGALTSYDAWQTIGGFDEKMFIDGVDFEFCERLHQHNYYIIRVADIELLHELGQMKTRKFLTKTINIKNHSALRKYYITRNRFYVAKKHKKPLSMTKAYLSATKSFLTVLFFERDKKAKCKAIFKGARDYRKM